MKRNIVQCRFYNISDKDIFKAYGLRVMTECRRTLYDTTKKIGFKKWKLESSTVTPVYFARDKLSAIFPL